MSALLEWGKRNPKTAGFLSFLALRKGYSTVKHWLSTPKSLKDQVVVITGGAMGLGHMMALKFFEEGSKVIIWDISKDAVEKCNAIRPNAAGGTISAKVVDVCNKKLVESEAQSVLAEYGRVDILVNNAGVVAGRPFMELTEKDIHRTFDVNVISQFWTLQSFLPSMVQRKKGHIVSIVSTAGHLSVSHLTDYCASKAAAKSLDEGIKRELMDLGQDEGIAFTGIYPGFMNTGMFEGAEYNDYLGSTLFSGRKMIEPEVVLEETMKAIKYEWREVILPYSLEPIIYYGKLLPLWFQDKLAVNTNSMKGFAGGKNRLSKL